MLPTTDSLDQFATQGPRNLGSKTGRPNFSLPWAVRDASLDGPLRKPIVRPLRMLAENLLAVRAGK
jgi:hypothetical protein